VLKSKNFSTLNKAMDRIWQHGKRTSFQNPDVWDSRTRMWTNSCGNSILMPALTVLHAPPNNNNLQTAPQKRFTSSVGNTPCYWLRPRLQIAQRLVPRWGWPWEMALAPAPAPGPTLRPHPSTPLIRPSDGCQANDAVSARGRAAAAMIKRPAPR